jgi:H+/Cl- antiporter ClcA
MDMLTMPAVFVLGIFFGVVGSLVVWLLIDEM